MQFDFGKNWKAFSKNALTQEKVAVAHIDFERLFSGIELKNTSFLDIGFGQGLSILLAKSKGAKVVGNDINPLCKEALALTAGILKTKFDIPVIMGSILDTAVCEQLKTESPNKEGYSIVHSWGVLHHTGNLDRALTHATSLVAPHGYCVVALYNKHFTSPIWNCIKWAYCKSPKVLRILAIALMYPIIMVAKALVIRKNPFIQARGMHFYYDVVDWVGGYPYEYLTIDECKKEFEKRGFDCCASFAASVPTGCNEYVFKRKEF